MNKKQWQQEIIERVQKDILDSNEKLRQIIDDYIVKEETTFGLIQKSAKEAGEILGGYKSEEQQIMECSHSKYHFVQININMSTSDGKIRGQRYAHFICEYCGKEKKVLVIEE